MSSKYYNLSTDTTLGGNSPSDYVAPSEKAIKTYVDNNAGSSLPSQTGNAGKVLTTDGTDASWGATAQVYPVVETYLNGNSWYRISAPDSTGYRWCVQGGYCSAGTFSYTFLKTFQSVPNVQLTHFSTYTGNITVKDSGLDALPTTTGFTITSNFTSTYYLGANWVAYGYIVDEV